MGRGSRDSPQEEAAAVDSVQVILNPSSCGGRAERVSRRVEAGLRSRGIEYEMHRTRGPGHGIELGRRLARRGPPGILVVGGDGTIHEVVNGLLEGSAPRCPSVAVVPVGTGNDFYRMVGTPGSVDEALKVLEKGRIRRFDVGRARWNGGSRFYVNLLGMGVDVEVLRRRRGFRALPGLLQYLAALLVALARFEPVSVRIRLDGEEVLEGRTHLTAVTVGPTAGGGFRLNPDARSDDGVLDLCFVKGLSLVRILFYLPRVVRGSHGSLDGVELRRFRSARLEAPDGVPFHFQLDGELMESPVTWIETEVLPGRLPVLVPDSEDP